MFTLVFCAVFGFLLALFIGAILFLVWWILWNFVQGLLKD